MSRTLTFAGIEYAIPFADLFRPHTDNERSALVDSIAKCGTVTAPVMIYDRMADAGGGLAVIDGATRLTIAAELGLAQVPVQHMGALSEEAAKAYCLDANLARRQLSIADQQSARKQRIALVVDLKKDGRSTRQIADKLGISQTQVLRDITSTTGSTATSDNGEPPGSPPDPDLTQLESARSTLRRLMKSLENLLSGKFATRLNQLLASHKAQCAAESLDAALADLSVDAVQWADEPDDA